MEGLTSWYGHLNSTSCKFSTLPPPTSLSPHRVRNRVFHLWWISRSRGRARPELIRDSVFSPIGSRRVERSNLRNPRNGRLSAGMTPPGKDLLVQGSALSRCLVNNSYQSFNLFELKWLPDNATGATFKQIS